MSTAQSALDFIAFTLGLTPDVAVVNEEMAIGVSYPPDGIDRGTNKEAP